MAVGRAAFERAVADFRLTDLVPPARALAVASASLDRTGLFLLGEVHGVAQTRVRSSGSRRVSALRALAFEWSHDELDDVGAAGASTGAFAFDALMVAASVGRGRLR